MMKFLSAATLALLFGAMSCADGDGDDGTNGGDGGAGSAGETGDVGGAGADTPEPLTCEKFKACGGELAGSYTIESVCAKNIETALAGDALPPECEGAFTGFETSVEGTVSFEDGTSTADFVQTISTTGTINTACWQALSGMDTEMSETSCQYVQMGLPSAGFTSGVCELDGEVCVCEAVLEQPVNTTQTYEVSGKELVFEDGTEASFCVSGKQVAVQMDQGEGVVVTYVGKSGS